MRAAAAHCDPSCDVEMVRGPLDILDHAAPWLGAGGKMGFDCTPKWTGEERDVRVGPTRERTFADHAKLTQDVCSIEGVRAASMPEVLGGWLFVSTALRGRAAIGELAKRVIQRADAAFVVIVGEDVDVADDGLAMFHWIANVDMLRDARVVGRMMWFDSTPKEPGEVDGVPVRDWPVYLETDEATRALIERKLESYGIREL